MLQLVRKRAITGHFSDRGWQPQRKYSTEWENKDRWRCDIEGLLHQRWGCISLAIIILPFRCHFAFRYIETYFRMPTHVRSHPRPAHSDAQLCIRAFYHMQGSWDRGNRGSQADKAIQVFTAQTDTGLSSRPQWLFTYFHVRLLDEIGLHNT